MHPDDERYENLVGKHVILPLVGRRIPIVADDYSDPEKGSGAVKVTPAHDFNDFEVGKRHGLPQISVLDQEGCLALVGNEDYLRDLPEGCGRSWPRSCTGVDRFAARKTHRRAAGGFRLPREDRAEHPHGAAWRPLRRRSSSPI